ncbi:CGNR zinc finger domain-containing protein [Amycolatopsis suaedae]|uniref:Zinc finger CGNR domain-containing protein n=1 Tax=Amycolatopsis suaedae TaxID=2510978 RepID=A0A4Q7J4J9_9PSEU|nr:ABATE domain-containing protein [Amycolatopsis suaedae]RZQ61626.1 hypothetical protein EWH70_21915 [Amycolatopsis suaedae]
MTEFPILGTEPFAVELANTLYRDGTEVIDFLGGDWFAEIGHPAPAGDARDLRDRVHRLFDAAATGREPDQADVDELNRLAATAPTVVRLDWRAGRRTARRLSQAEDASLGRIAAEAVELLGGSELRRCEGPGCAMLFVRGHARRRFCYPGCGQRGRQARYYRRKRGIR